MIAAKEAELKKVTEEAEEKKKNFDIQLAEETERRE